MVRTGRRPGSTDTREAIRDVARRQFVERGYEATTIRGIAAGAGVDPALVMHFFGSKEALFAACIEWPFDAEHIRGAILDGKRSGVGERLVRLFLTTWDDEAGRTPIVALLRTAMSQETAARMLRDFLSNRLFRPTAEALRLDHPDLRVSLASSQLVGLGIARYVLRYEPLASLHREEVVALVAPTVQRYFTGRLPVSDARGGSGRAHARGA